MLEMVESLERLETYEDKRKALAIVADHYHIKDIRFNPP